VKHDAPQELPPPVALSKVRSAPVPAVIELLEGLLEDARSGYLRGFVFAGQTSAHETLRAHCIGEADVAHLVCAIEREKLALLLEGG
jgi:hypothetical protein